MLHLDELSKPLLEELKEWAESEGVLEGLQVKLDYLDNYGQDPKKIRVRLFSDRQEHCLGITWEKEVLPGHYDFWMAGGLIFHKDSKTWGIHT